MQRLTIAAAAALLALAAPTLAQWKVVRLHPEGADRSIAYSVHGGQQVGGAGVNGVQLASVWSGTPASWRSLHLWPGEPAAVWDTDGGRQVGTTWFDNVPTAGLWSDTAASWVSLEPPGAEGSWGNGIDKEQQCGQVLFKGKWRASLWTGTAASWVDLHPANAESSDAHGSGDGQQAGCYRFGFGTPSYACVWSGTAQSFVSLHPVGAHESHAFDASDGQQVGHVDRQAAVWFGTPTYRNLAPPGSVSSIAYGVFRGVQVGWVQVAGPGPLHAALWQGSPGSFVDLHAFLGPEFSSSEARGVWYDGAATYVVGFGHRWPNLRREALLWIGPPPPWTCYPDCDGDNALTLADFSCFQTKFALADPYADCNSDDLFNLADFGCFQTRFALGCP